MSERMTDRENPMEGTSMTQAPELDDVTPLSELPDNGRNGELRTFVYRHTDGRIANVNCRRIATARKKTWEVAREHWFVFEAEHPEAGAVKRDWSLLGQRAESVSSSTSPASLRVGQQVRLGVRRMPDRRWWTVRARDDRFVILTRQAPFEARGNSEYTIIDVARDLRGPCDLLGNGWDVDEPGGVESLLRALQRFLETEARLASGATEVAHDGQQVQVSFRNNVPIEIYEVLDA